MMKQNQISYLLALSFSLAACGGGSGGGSSSSSSTGGANASAQVAIATQNLERKIQIGETKSFNLNEIAVASQGGVKLTQTPQLIYGDPSCQISVDDETLSVTSDQVNDCVFQYQAQSSLDPSSQAEGYMRLNFASTGENNTLPPIVKNLATISPQEIKLSTELANLGIDISEYELSPEILVVDGNGTVTIKSKDRNPVEMTDIDGQQIEKLQADDVILYTPERSTQGSVTTIFYTYRQTESTMIQSRSRTRNIDPKLKSGTIYLSVSDPLTRANRLPVAKNFEIGNVDMDSEAIQIDVEPYIYDDNENDGVQNDVLQLVDVQSVNNVVNIKETDNFDSTLFDFYTSVPGRHDVLYTIHDHYGGYANGLVTIKVGEDAKPVQLLDWDGITLPSVTINKVTATNLTFMAPLDKGVAELMNVSYQSIAESNLGDGGVITMNYAYATDYCAIRGGRLPTKEELQKLYDSSLDDVKNKLAKWPKGQSYWTLDRTSVTTSTKISLANKQQQNVDTGYPIVGKQYDNTNYAYVTCIQLEDDTPKLELSSVPSYNNSGYSITSTMLMPYGQKAQYQLLYLTVENSGGRLSIDSTSGGYYGEDSFIRVKGWAYSNSNGTLNFGYMDESFNPQVITIRNTASYQAEPLETTFLEQISLIPFQDDTSTTLTPLNPNDWYRYSNKIGKLEYNDITYPLNRDKNQYTGLPVWLIHEGNVRGKNSRIVSMYTGKKFRGNTYTIRLKISAQGENTPTSGQITFQLTDASVLPSDNAKAAEKLMQSGSLVGVPNNPRNDLVDKAITYTLHFGEGSPLIYNGSYTGVFPYQNNGFAQITLAGSRIVPLALEVGSLFGKRQKDMYIWLVGSYTTPQFAVVDGQKYHGPQGIYISDSPFRPEVPVALVYPHLPSRFSQNTDILFSIVSENYYDSSQATMNDTYIEDIDVRFGWN